MIHEVANADECSHEPDGDAQAVEGPEHIFFGDVPTEYEDCDDDTNGAAMAGKAAFPHLEDVGRVLRVVGPVVEKDMS